MKGFLREAFTLACDTVQTIGKSIEKAYDCCNVFLWRALMDDDFLSIDKHDFESPFMRKVAGLCDMGLGKLRENAVDLGIGGRGGDLYPKPSNTAGILKVLVTTLGSAGRSGLHNPGAVAAGVIVAGVAAFAYASGSHAVPDALATWQSSRPGAPNVPRP